MPSSRTKLKPMLWLLPLIASMIMLSACADSTTTKFCPSAIVPDNTTLDWIDKTKTPAGFDAWFDKIVKQQAFFDAGCV